MAEGTVDFDVRVQSNQAQSELDKVREKVEGITSHLTANINTIENRLGRLSQLMAKSMKDAQKLGGMSLARAEARELGMKGGILGDVSQGGQTSKFNKAAGQSIISELVNTTEAMTAKITDTIVKTALQQLRATEAAVEARIKQAVFSQNQTIANSGDRYMNARATLAEQRRQDNIFAAENGRAALASRNRMESLNFNGGADLMAIQGRVMMNYAAVGALFSTVTSATAGIIELDKELHQFQAISASSNKEMLTFKDRMLDIAEQVPFTAVEVTKAATMLAQAGLSTSEVTDSLDDVAKFATATGSDISQAVDIVTSSLTAFNLETNRTGQVANTFTAALNLSKLSVDKMVTALNYIGPTANEVGLTLEETTAVLGALSQSGIRASTMGTGFRSLLTDLQSPSKKLMETLSNAGLSVDDINVKTKGFLPVIETLRKAGFGAAEAYASLELRSAAAYVALSNNTNMAYKLQDAFLLSTAATKANDIQMKSFANTAKNLGGTLSAAAFTAFEPLLRMMQGALEATNNLLVDLDKIPGVLQVIGAAAAALGTAMTVSLGASLLRSMFGMVPILSTISAGIGGLVTSAAAATGVIGSLGRGLLFLAGIPVGGWIAGIAAAVVGVTTLFYTFGDSSKNLADELDALQGKLSDLEGEADATEKKITSIDQAIQGVIDRREELEDNGKAFDLKVNELRAQFVELGLAIREDVTSVTDLINKLHDLKQTSSQLRASQLEARNLSLNEQIELLRKQQDEQRSNVKSTLDDVVSRSGLGTAQGFYDTARPGLDAAFGRKYGQTAADALRIARGDTTFLGNDPTKAALGVQAIIQDLENTIFKGLKAGTDVSDLETLLEAVKPLAQSFIALQEATKKLELGIDERDRERVRSSDTTKRLETRAGEIQTEHAKRLAEINDRSLPADQKIAELKNLDSWLQKEIEDARVATYREATNNGLPNDVNPAALGEVFGPILDELRALGLSAKGQESAAQKDLRKTLERDNRRETTKQDDKLTKARQDVTNARNKEEFEVFKKERDKLTQESIQATRERYKELIALVNDPDDKERLREELADQIDQYDRDATKDVEADVRKDLDLQKEAMQRQKEAIQDVAKGTQKQIDLALKELNSTPPGEAFSKLVQKIKELNNNLAQQLGRVASLDTQMAGIDMGQPITPATAGSGLSIMKTLMSMGLSKDGAAAVVGNLDVESGFRPTAVGDRGSAIGLAQWRGPRLEELRRDFGMDTTSQLKFLVHELKRDYPQLLAQLQAGGDPQALAKSFMDIFERPNADPNINHIGRRQRTAASFALADVSSGQATVDDNQQALTTAIDDGTREAAKAAADATIKKLKSRLSTLSTQVRLNDDTGSLDEIQTAVREAHDGIMKAELEKFDAENKGNLELPDVKNRRQELQDGLKQNLTNDLLKVMDEWRKAAEEELNRPVDAAKADLSAMRDNPSKFTEAQVQAAEQRVIDAEHEASRQRVLLIEQQIAEVRQRAEDAERSGDTASANNWRIQENELISQNNQLKRENNALDAAKVAQGPSVIQGIQSATQAWGQQNGILDSMGDMIPLGKQVENTWGQILDGLSSGFSSFFSNIASGTMTAKDAFKQLGLSILDMFMQIIAKALANQIIMSLFGGGGATGGSSIFGSLAEGLFGIVGGGAANGKIVRAANGMSPFRDNVLVNVMPGEGILRKSAMDVIGDKGFNELNNLGNRQVSAGALKGRAANQNDQQGNGTVNVWVVSQDQVPPAGPNDIIATVADNISRRGAIKQLIQQVQMGAI